MLISFVEFTALQSLVLPFTPAMPWYSRNLEPHMRCFPNSLTTLTLLRGAKLVLPELRAIINNLCKNLRKLEAYMIASYDNVQAVLNPLGAHTITLGDQFQGAQWMYIHITRP